MTDTSRPVVDPTMGKVCVKTRSVRIGLLLLHSVAVAIFFLPFSWHVSPCDVFIDGQDREFIFMAAPFVLVFVIWLLQVRTLFKRILSRWESWSTFGLTGGAAVCFVWSSFGWMIQGLFKGGNWQDLGRMDTRAVMVVRVAWCLTATLGVLGIFKALRPGSNTRAVVWPRTVLWANAILCLVTFYNDGFLVCWASGAWLTLGVVGLYTIEIGLLVLWGKRADARLSWWVPTTEAGPEL